MKSPDRALAMALGKLPKSTRYTLARFIRFVAERKAAYFRRHGLFLSSISVNDFEDAGITLGQIEVALTALRELPQTNEETSKDIATIPASLPRLRGAGGDAVVENLSLFQPAPLLKELAGMGYAPPSFWKKVPVCISEKKGIYRLDQPAEAYQIRGGRLQLVLDIYQGKQPTPQTAVQRANLSRDVSDINKIFSATLGTAASLINHSNTSGYFLNDDAYEITVELLSTKLETD